MILWNYRPVLSEGHGEPFATFETVGWPAIAGFAWGEGVPQPVAATPSVSLHFRIVPFEVNRSHAGHLEGFGR
jgi:hypothetical protein